MITIGDVKLHSLVMNAACSVAKTTEDVRALAATNIGAVLVGSITVQAREGNEEPRWYSTDGFALNSFGMPNGGIGFYQENLSKMANIIHKSDKAFILSIAGFTTKEYLDLSKLADSYDVDIIELNLGCPNISIDGVQKPIVSFDRDKMLEIISAVREVTQKPLMVKLSPYSNPAELQLVAECIARSGQIAGVVTMNTFPNSFYTQSNKAVLASEYGGMSGKAILPISLGQVRQFREHLPSNIVVIGVGGIESRQDAELFYQAGAGAVQAATLIVRDGHSAINKISGDIT